MLSRVNGEEVVGSINAACVGIWLDEIVFVECDRDVIQSVGMGQLCQTWNSEWCISSLRHTNLHH